MAGAREANLTEDVFKGRWVEELHPNMILTVDGKKYLIVRADEIGRRQGWQIYGKAIT